MILLSRGPIFRVFIKSLAQCLPGTDLSSFIVVSRRPECQMAGNSCFINNCAWNKSRGDCFDILKTVRQTDNHDEKKPTSRYEHSVKKLLVENAWFFPSCYQHLALLNQTQTYARANVSKRKRRCQGDSARPWEMSTETSQSAGSTTHIAPQ